MEMTILLMEALQKTWSILSFSVETSHVPNHRPYKTLYSDNEVAG